jgi:collagenase-like PrtC family protease
MVAKPELLAPAGNNESLIAAVLNGCDAVYLGATMLSARASAANFTPDELADAIDYAHLRGVKAYVAVNTLVKDSETNDAADLLYHLDESGADAVIVQDVGLLSMARSLAPDLPIHASTQMTVHNSEGAGFLQDMGVKRVVLAREMTLDEIKQVRQNTDLEIEIFVHGALCISYSGQCLMSSMIGGRSGNRGVCAQPCRKRYRLRTLSSGREVKTDGEYLLSPRDLNTSQILPELIEAGIDSFKIEGRLKRPEYVACVTRIYRGLIDRYVTSSPLQATGLPASQDAQRRISTGLNSAQSVRTYDFANISPALSALRDKLDSTQMCLKVSVRDSSPLRVAGSSPAEVIKDPPGYFVMDRQERSIDATACKGRALLDDESRHLAQVFNRGFTAGYLTGNPRGELMSRKRPYNRGIPIGTVIGCGQNRLRIRLSGTLCIGDGIGVTGAAGAEGEVTGEGEGVGVDDGGSGHLRHLHEFSYDFIIPLNALRSSRTVSTQYSASSAVAATPG